MLRTSLCIALNFTLTAGPQDPLPKVLPRASMVDRPVWGCCHAASGEVDPQSGGFASSGNLPVPIPGDVVAPAGELSLIARPDRVPRPDFGHAMTLMLANRTGKTVWLNAVDSSLPIFQEARDEAGNWRAIEYPWTEDIHAWCGNSYHRVALPDGKCWVFAVPRYLGPRMTQLRFRFDGPQGRILSAPFSGGVHPGQLQDRVPGRGPGVVFDPRTGFQSR